MHKSFWSLHGFSDTFNVSPFIPVIVGMAITHHLLLTSLRVNVSYIPMQIYLSPLMSDATAALGQMVLLRYVAQQSVAIQEKQSQSKPVPGVNRGKPDSTLESEDELMIPDKARHDILHEKPDLTPSKKDWQEAKSSLSSLTPVVAMGPPDSPKPTYTSTTATAASASGQEAQHSKEQESAVGWLNCRITGPVLVELFT